MDILGMEVKYEIRQTVQTRRSNFQQNIKEVNKAFVVDKSLINNKTISYET